MDRDPWSVADYRAVLGAGSRDRAADRFDREDPVEGLVGAALAHEGLPEVELLACASPDEARRAIAASLAEERPFAAAFLDLASGPAGAGPAWLAGLRAIDADLTLVLAAAGEEHHPAELCSVAGPAERLRYLRKPFHPFEVQQLVLSLADSRPLRSEPAAIGLLDAPGAGVLVFDRQDRLVSANEAARLIFQDLSRLLVPGSAYAAIQTGLARHLLPEDTLYRTEAWVRERLAWHRAGGGILEQRLRGRRWILIAEGPLRGGGTACCVYDITDAKRRDERRAQASRTALMAQTLGAVCDRLPLSAALRQDHLSGGKVVPLRPAPKGGEAIGEASWIGPSDRLGSMTRLVSRLHAVAQRQRLEPSILDLKAAVSRALTRQSVPLPSDVSVALVAGPGLWPVLVDEDRLRPVLVELVENACDAMEGVGDISVEVANLRVPRDIAAAQAGPPPGDYVRVSVRDTGPGFPPDLLGRALDPFFTSKPGAGNLGLGLSMAHGFAAQSGGHLEIAETVEGGEVALYFPRARAAQAAAEPPLARSSD